MIIRFALASDAPKIAEIYAPFVDGSAVSFEMEPPAADIMAGRIEKLWPTHPWIVAEEGGEVFAIVQRFDLVEAISRSSCKWRRGSKTDLWPASSRVLHRVFMLLKMWI